MIQPLISIIIPTYNRAHLIGETLDSVSAQTYTNWECIVVDDGSTDGTGSLLADYCKKDFRFQYHLRPKDRPKGANACRNYGFELSKGEFVNWFDSDDLMSVDNISVKLNAIANFDFVVSYSLDFNEIETIGKIYDFDLSIPINAENFINQTIGWITNDALIKRWSIENIHFNENLNSGQEYNFFSRMLFITNNGRFIDKCLAKRRVHSQSIHQKAKSNQRANKIELFRNESILLDDLKSVASERIIKRSLKRMIRFSYESQTKYSLNKRQFIAFGKLLKYKMIKPSFFYFLWVFSNLLTGKGYIFISRIYKYFARNV